VNRTERVVDRARRAYPSAKAGLPVRKFTAPASVPPGRRRSRRGFAAVRIQPTMTSASDGVAFSHGTSRTHSTRNHRNKSKP
jgi:hypothetical protein